MVQLNELLDKSSLKVIGYFVNKPSGEISQKELQKRTKLAKATIIKSVNKLVKHDLLVERRIGVTKLLKLNIDNIIIKQLKIINTLLHLQELKSLAREYNLKIYLYGSCARGEDVEESDIDLLIVGKISKEEIVKDIKKTSEKIKKEIRPVVTSATEWSKMAKKDKPFYEMVERDKIELK